LNTCAIDMLPAAISPAACHAFPELVHQVGRSATKISSLPSFCTSYSGLFRLPEPHEGAPAGRPSM
jgi:hypothetical protein